MKRRFLISTPLVVTVSLIVSAIVFAYGQNLSFPAARRFVVTQEYHAGHMAYDYAFPNHVSLVAAKAGTVSASSWVYADNQSWYPCAGNITDRGNYIILDHGGGLLTHYYHLSNTGGTPGTGASFQRGGLMALSDNTGCSKASHLHYAVTVVGTSGNTGHVDPPAPLGKHLHFEVRQNGVAVNPDPLWSDGEQMGRPFPRPRYGPDSVIVDDLDSYPQFSKDCGEYPCSYWYGTSSYGYQGHMFYTFAWN